MLEKQEDNNRRWEAVEKKLEGVETKKGFDGICYVKVCGIWLGGVQAGVERAEWQYEA